jgi:hypothetical protein
MVTTAKSSEGKIKGKLIYIKLKEYMAYLNTIERNASST